jgi:MT0933-like antitoxin protein
MSFLDKAKKLAEQAAEKAAPLIDKAAPHAQNAVDKAGQQIDKRTGGKYRDKIEAVEAKVGELADKRLATRGGAAETAAVADDVFPAQPGAAAPAADEAFPAQPSSAPFPAQPDAAGQPDDPAYSAPPVDAGEQDYPGLSEGPGATPEAVDEDDRPPAGPASGSPTP